MTRKWYWEVFPVCGADGVVWHVKIQSPGVFMMRRKSFDEEGQVDEFVNAQNEMIDKFDTMKEYFEWYNSVQALTA